MRGDLKQRIKRFWQGMLRRKTRTAQGFPQMMPRAGDLMRPRHELPVVPQTSGHDEIWQIFRSQGVSSLAVFDGTKDNTLGFLSLMDFICVDPLVPWESALKPLSYFTISSPLDSVWQELQVQKHAFGIVVDEYGGVDGVIYAQDVASFFVGQWRLRAGEQRELSITRRQGNSYSVEGDCPLAILIEDVRGSWLADILQSENASLSTMSLWIKMTLSCRPARGEVLMHTSGMLVEIREVIAGVIQSVIFYPPSVAIVTEFERNSLAPGQNLVKNV